MDAFPLPVDSPSLYRPTRSTLTAISEALLTVLTCTIVWYLASPLVGAGGWSGSPVEWLAVLPEELAERRAWLPQHIGLALAIVAAAGWLALWLGRQASPVLVRLFLLLALWSLAACLVAGGAGRGFLALEGEAWSKVCQATSAGGLLAALISGQVVSHRRPARAARSEASVFVYPGWVLLGGIGNLWLVDYAARGYGKYANLGVYQFDAWLLANVVLTGCAAVLPEILAGWSRVMARIEGGRDGGIAVFMAAGLVWALGVVLVVRGFGLRDHVALFTEALRLPIWLAAAWIVYRWIASGLRPFAAFAAIGVLMAGMAAAMFAMDDKGPILVQAIAVALFLGSLAAAPVWQRHSLVAGMGLAVPVATGLCALIVWGVYRYAPAERLAALLHPHQGPLEFLSEIRWFLHAVPPGGFGLGQVPWCGNGAMLGVASCAGVPRQIQSDYVFAGLAGVWGEATALLWIGLLLVWLAALTAARFRRASGRAVDIENLVGWLIATGISAYATQTVVSLLGTLGTIPLTGVSIPLFSYGATSLITLSLLTGMAVSPTHRNATPAEVRP